jgi:hypothetical protein
MAIFHQDIGPGPYPSHGSIAGRIDVMAKDAKKKKMHEFEARAEKADLDVNEKVKFRKYMKTLVKESRKAKAYDVLAVISEVVFFWSILTAAVISSKSFLEGSVSGSVLAYFEMVESFFVLFEGPTAAVMPYAFISMMTFGMLRGSAGGAKTKTEINIISLLTFAEQKSLLYQMQNYVDTAVADATGHGTRSRGY